MSSLQSMFISKCAAARQVRPFCWSSVGDVRSCEKAVRPFTSALCIFCCFMSVAGVKFHALPNRQVHLQGHHHLTIGQRFIFVHHVRKSFICQLVCHEVFHGHCDGLVNLFAHHCGSEFNSKPCSCMLPGSTIVSFEIASARTSACGVVGWSEVEGSSSMTISPSSSTVSN